MLYHNTTSIVYIIDVDWNVVLLQEKAILET